MTRFGRFETHPHAKKNNDAGSVSHEVHQNQHNVTITMTNALTRKSRLGIVLHMGPSSSGREASVYHEKFLDGGLHVLSNNKIDKHLSVPVSTLRQFAYNLQTSNPSEYQECDPH